MLAARSIGTTNTKMIIRHILPNVLSPIMVSATLGIANAIITESALSFLGLSVKAPTPSWGGIIAEGREVLSTVPHIAMYPTIIMFLTVLSFNLVGDAIRRRLADVREGAI